MKNLKNTLISLLTIASICSSQFIQSSESFAAPTVEISNKSTMAIGVAIYNLDNGVVHTMAVPSGKRQKYDTDINSRLRFEIWSTSQPDKALGVFSVNAPGKTKYITWNPAKTPSFYPQTGPLAGFGKIIGMKTESGLSLSNNLSSSNIKAEAAQLSMGQAPSRPVSKPTQPVSQSTRPVSQTSQPVSSSLDVEITNKLNRQIILGFGRDQEFLNPNTSYDAKISNKGPISVEVFDVKRDRISGSDEELTTYSGTEYSFVINPVNKQTINLEIVPSGSAVTLRPKGNLSSNVQQNEIQPKGSSKVEKTEFMMGSFSFSL